MDELTLTTGKSTASADLRSAAPSLLDTISLSELLKVILRSTGDGTLGESELAKLDSVYRRKLLQLLESGADPREVDLLDDHLGRVLNPHLIRAELRAKWSERWGGFRALLADVLSHRDSQSVVSEATPSAVKNSLWEAVAELVLRAGSEGAAWSELAARLDALDGGKSKSTRSNQLAQLKAAGWINERIIGKTKRFVPGVRIADSRAARTLSQRPHVWSADATDSEPTTRRLIREYVCYMQGRLIQYFHLMNSRHRDIRLALEGTPGSASVHVALAKFLGYLNEELVEVSTTTFNMLQRHFASRSTSQPRFCLKGNWSNDSVVDILRDSQMTHGSPSSVARNTGFARVKDTGKFFFANNLPEMVLKGQYENPRIDPARVKTLRERLRSTSESADIKMAYEDWYQCWFDGDESVAKSEPSRFYRSTLIVPCTIWNNSLSDFFVERLRQQAPELQSVPIERLILGYLCLDHVDTDYFNQGADVDVAYTAADLLSVFLFARWLLTSVSSTYMRASNMVHFSSEEKRFKVRTQLIGRIAIPQPEQVSRSNVPLTLDPTAVQADTNLQVSIDDLERLFAGYEDAETDLAVAAR